MFWSRFGLLKLRRYSPFFPHNQRLNISMHFSFSQAKFCESGIGFYESGESGNPEGVAPMYHSES